MEILKYINIYIQYLKGNGMVYYIIKLYNKILK